MKSVRKRLTYANVMSTIAVFLVLGGTTAFAATQLGANSVGTSQLKKEAVALSKIKKAARIALQGQTGPAGAAGAKGASGAQGPKGDQGDRGERGEKGETGEKGASGTAGIHEVLVKGPIGANTTGSVSAECPAGEVATGGGGNSGGNSEAVMYQNAPRPPGETSGATPTGWTVYWKTGGTPMQGFVYVLCAKP